jgi:thiol:disulfide interchange protein DsbD
MNKVRFAVLFLLMLATVAFAQDDQVKWSAKGPDKPLRAGDKFAVTLSAKISEGWHLYSFTQPAGGPTTATVSIPESQPFKQSGVIRGPVPNKTYDPNFEMETESYEGTVQFDLPLVVESSATDKMDRVALDVKFQVCNESMCIPAKTVHLSVPVQIIARKAASTLEMNPSADLTAEVSTPPSSAVDHGSNQSELHGSGTGAVEKGQEKPILTTAQSQPKSLRAFLWLAVVMGALSLLTPCVFPMIPITVSYFTNHSRGVRRHAVSTALVYGIGIILTFTALGMLLAVLFGAGGVNQLAANPWVNLLITAIFLGFAFSLFGAYFIQVPSGLLDRMTKLTRSQQGGQTVGALLMGFTFTLTSFTCTAPFVGTLLVMTSQGNWRWPLAGMLAFSTVFAIPFFVLALIPQLVSQLPKAGGWMVSVKVVMGFLEIAAAMKFLSNADLVWHWGIFTRQVVLAVWVAIGILTVLYVLGYFRMPHDSPVELVGTLRVSVAIVVLTVTVWLIPGLFGRRLGELESFLPPEVTLTTSATASSADAPTDSGWILNDYEGALARAKQENKLVFIDFTGYTCTNCRWMEANMFPRPEVTREMEKFVRVRLYTDGDGEVFQRQQKMQQEQFGTVALPYYVIAHADGSPVTTFPGLTRNAGEFLRFLEQGTWK